ncbi:MAG: S-layer homology domain-containing protein [Armatimonadota bacterium]
MSVWRSLLLCVVLCLTLAAVPGLGAAPFTMIPSGELAYGIPHDVAVQGSYAYVAAEGAVSVLDITTPAHPVQVAVVDTPGSAEGIAVSGNYAYVADWDGGLRIIDITDPTAPSEVGHYDTPGFAYGVAVSGNYAYIADHAAGLQIIDVTAKASPTPAGSYDTPGYAWNVAVSGDYAFVADGFAGLLVLDVSTPASPTVAGSCAATNSVNDVAVSGDYAYVADGTAGLRLIGITWAPFALDCSVGSLALSGSAKGVAVSGSTAYVAADTAGLIAVDVTDPASPALSDSFDTVGRACAVAISGAAAYVADDSGGLRVVEVAANPAPVIVGHAATSGNAEAVAVKDSIAYVADGNGGLRAFDVSNITVPSELWECDGSTQAMDVAVDDAGQYAYVADWNGKLEVLEVTGATSVACDVGECAIPGGHPNGVALASSRAYVASGSVGLAIVNVGNPLIPSVINTVNTPGSASGVAVFGDYAYVADGSQGLQIVDVASPTGAAIVGSGSTSGYSWDVAVSGTYAYAASGDAGIQIYDITSPVGARAPLASLALSGSAHSISVRDDYAFVSVGGRGVVVVDIADPANPAVVSSCGTPSVPGPSDLAIAGGYAYVADAESGLVIVDILSPYIELAALESPAYAERMAVSGSGDDSGIGYMAAGPQGLQIVQVSSSEEAADPALARSNRSLGDVNDVAVASPYAYVTDTSGRLTIMNLTNPTNPYKVGSVVTSGSALGVTAAAVGASNFALVAGGYQGLSSVATSVVSTPTERAVNDTPGWCSEVATAMLAGDPFALIADGDAGLRLLNLTPLSTAPVTIFSEVFNSLSGWTQGGTVELYSGGARLRQDGSITRTVSTVGYSAISVTFSMGATLSTDGEYAVAEWSADGVSWGTGLAGDPHVLARIDNGDAEDDGQLHPYSVDLPSSADGNAAFALRFRVVGDSSDDSARVDTIAVLSESSSRPQEVGFYNTGGQAKGVAWSGDYALVADGDAGLRIIDVSSPGAPVEVSHIDLAGGDAEAVATYGRVAVVADGNNGVSVVDFNKPATPFEIAHYDTPGWATDVKLLDNQAWVADSGWGLTILQLWYSFKDIPYGFWSFSEVEDATSLSNAVGNKITVGYDDGKYHPEIQCSRDQMSVFIARAENWVAWDQALNTEAALFDDVPAGYWAGTAIKECIDHGVITGYNDHYFRPGTAVKRDDMCVFIARAKGWVAVGDAMDHTSTGADLFPDVASNYWCASAIEACMNNGIVLGYLDGYYRPYLAVTRDQMAVFIWRSFLQ